MSRLSKFARSAYRSLVSPPPDPPTLPHFRDEVHRLFDQSEKNPELKACLGMAVINQRQTDIILNMCRHVIADHRFLVFDVGANDGWFIDRMFREPRNIQVVAFEPLREMLPELRKRQQRYHNVEIVPKAVGDKVDRATLKMCAEVTGLSSLLDYEPGYQYFHRGFQQEARKEYEVEVVPLDKYMRESPQYAGYDHIALKIDTQGYELQVLEGAREMLASGKVKAVLIELVTRPKYKSSATYGPILNFLHEYGFEMFDMLPFYREIDMQFKETPEGRLTEFDCLMVHRDFLAKYPV